MAAQTTARYISFLENGRATPTRSMLERLAEALDMDTQQCNALFEAAGYLPVRPVAGVPALEPGRLQATIDQILIEHMPHPAFAVYPDWTLISVNPAANRLLRLGAFPEPNASIAGLNVVDIVTRPDGLRPWIRNWEEYTWHAIQCLHGLWRHTGTPPGILERVRCHPGVAALEQRLEPPDDGFGPGHLVLVDDHRSWPYLQLRSRIAPPPSVNQRDVVIELLFPTVFDHGQEQGLDPTMTTLDGA